MILAHGKIYENKFQDEIIASLQRDICKTLASSKLETEKVIAACGKVSQKAQNGEFDGIAKPLLEMLQMPYETYIDYCKMFSAENLEKKVKTELAGFPLEEEQISEHLFRRCEPLGVLLHIAAGNVDALPAYSVIEGLLAGNVNILKLPTGDSGVSVKLLSELIKECPELADYIYVFDVPSTETETIKALADIANGVVVWGGDAAVTAAHRFIDPNTKLIVWGHKLSFAYAKPNCQDEMLLDLAKDICKTNQTLCSSCQGIYVDTEDEQELYNFALRFFEILKGANAKLGKAPRGMRGKNTLKLYTDKLEGAEGIFCEEGVSVVVKRDSELELSYLFRNVWIKPLPKEQIIPVLKPKKGYLQSCALLLPNGEEREQVADCLIKAGVTRITDGNMSKMMLGESHDGSFALKEYSRLVDIYK